ncbi:MAG: hypothetical protein ACI4V4_02725 [Eubacterium sp.]
MLDKLIGKRKLEKMPYAQAIVREYSDGDVLQSYDTDVIIHHSYLNADCTTSDTYDITGLYSMSTRKHISAYAAEHGLSYKDFKYAYDKNAVIYITHDDDILFVDSINGNIISANI